jgi:integrase
MSVAIKERYIKEYTENSQVYYKVYICKVSKKIKGLKAQKRITKIEDISEARKLRDKWNDLVIRDLTEKEAQGHTWGDIVEKWERYWRDYPTRTFNQATMKDHIARMENWTQSWMDRPVRTLSIKDSRDLIKKACENGASILLRTMIKRTINLIFKWGIEEGLITGLSLSPAKNIEILMQGERKEDIKKPEILTWPEIYKLTYTAKNDEHAWFGVWLIALHSGMRSGELEALSKENIDLVPLSVAEKLDLLADGDSRKSYGFINVEWAWKVKEKFYGPTKAHYWRQIPINQELYYFFVEYLKSDFGHNEYPDPKDESKTIQLPRAFPKLANWRGGNQASVLRLFCESRGLKSIKFHTLRACFATQLLGLGVKEEEVRKIGGWKDVDTIRIYVRTAGILESGVTQGLKFMKQKKEYDINSAYRNVEYVKASKMNDVLTREVDLQLASGDEHGKENILDINSFRKQ